MVLASRRLPEGVAGIETDHGLWAMALIAAAYQVFPVNPQQTARFRARHQVPGAKSDAGDAHMLADMVRTDSHQREPPTWAGTRGRVVGADLGPVRKYPPLCATPAHWLSRLQEAHNRTLCKAVGLMLLLKAKTIDPQAARLPNPGLLIKVQPGTTEVRALAVDRFAPMGSVSLSIWVDLRK